MKLSLLVLSSVLLGLNAPAQDEVRLELAKFEGTWQPVYVEVDGQPYKGEYKDDRLVISGKNYQLAGPKVKMEGIIKIDPSKSPRHMDTEVTGGDGKGTKTIGIYEMDGQNLMVCYCMVPGDRPTDFTTKANSNRALVKYKRTKK
jgi:uncharacterized protein (TIGR03067 family)